ncbi:glomulin-like isoform X1 [Nerophis ophidion]|uniref:glomulin-like isoform X1 n=1 Tax=Nerophis ophidion TaxID=159077 RepID=UPI002AE0589F|nr:glomulin-like isoform X1 [Nerophis ophidion]
MMNEDEVNKLIQRWRDSPEDNLKPEDYQQFKDLACLTQVDSEYFLTLLQDEKNQSMVKYMGCVLLTPLMEKVLEKDKSCDQIQAAITHVTTTCRPHEVLENLIVVVEDADPDAISETLVASVPHLQTGLLRLEEGRASSLGTVLSVLHKQLTRLPVPYTEQQEADDEFGVCRCCTALTSFTKPFLEEVRSNGGNHQEMKLELLNFCIRSLREPLLEAELTPQRDSPLWLFASHIMVTLEAINQSITELLFFSTKQRNIQMDKSQLAESKGCLAYLLFVRLLAMECIPTVLSPEFILQCNVEYIHQLLSSKRESHLLKGLALFERCLERVHDNSLAVNLLELKSFYHVKQSLLQVLTDCPMQHLRESGEKVLQLLIHKLEAEAKHKLFRYLLETSKHPGVQCYIVKNIQHQVESSMKLGNATGCFLGAELLPLLGLVLTLANGAETDLLHNKDKIMASLNLLCYLLSRDKALSSNAAVWEDVSRMRDEYTRMLRVCITMSRSYYMAELKALRDDHRLKAREARASTGTCLQISTVKPGNLSKRSPEVQHQVLQSALVTFDLMESLIVRTEESIPNKLLYLCEQ